MNDFLPRTISAATMTGTIILSLAACSAIAQTADTPVSARCTATPDRAIGLKYVPSQKSLSDLSITVAKNQENNLSLADVSLLEGPCVGDIFAFRMNQVVFTDGAVFSAKSQDQFVYSPNIKGLTNWGGEPLSTGHPAMAQSEFIMAVNVDTFYIANEKRLLDVGLWKTSKGYLAAAFIRQKSGFSTPVELIRSTQPIKSVTFFPSPDSNSGTLGLLERTGSDISLVSLNWNHNTLSKTLSHGSTD